MDNASKHIKELLQKLIQGSISVEERQLLSQKAKSDPFLADTLEGLQAHPINHAPLIDNLRQSLQQRQDKKETPPIFMFRTVAAVILFLIIGVGVLYVVNQNFQKTTSLAEQNTTNFKEEKGNETTLEINPQIQDSISSIENPIPPIEEELASELIAERSKDVPLEEEISMVYDRSEEVEEAPAIVLDGVALELENLPENGITSSGSLTNADEISAPPSATPSVSDYISAGRIESVVEEPSSLSDDFADVELSAEEDGIDLADKRKQKDLNDTLDSKLSDATREDYDVFVVKGQVRDINGEIIIGANVIQQDSDMGTISNLEGKFTLATSNPDKPLEINALGYQSQIINFDLTEDLDIVLEEETLVLSEVVTSSLKKENSTYQEKMDYDSTIVGPLAGYKAYSNYIDRNIIYPDAAMSANIEGKVRIEFEVKNDGTPHNFNVKKSLGYGCDEEAIRLLEKGPKWRVPQVRKKSSYTIKFKKNKKKK